MADTITIQGNIGNDPQRVMTQAGVAITKFSVGSTHRVFDEEAKQWVDKYTNWYSVSAFRNLGENAFASLKRGDSVIVKGRLTHSTWEANGRSGSSLDLDADSIGVDLRWGTAHWERRGKPNKDSESPEETQEADAAEIGTASHIDEDGWAVPSAELVGAKE